MALLCKNLSKLQRLCSLVSTGAFPEHPQELKAHLLRTKHCNASCASHLPPSSIQCLKVRTQNTLKGSRYICYLLFNYRLAVMLLAPPTITKVTVSWLKYGEIPLNPFVGGGVPWWSIPQPLSAARTSPEAVVATALAPT